MTTPKRTFFGSRSLCDYPVYKTVLPGSQKNPVETDRSRQSLQSSGQKASKLVTEMLLTFLEKLPLGQGGKVFVGTSICLAICAYPVIRKRTRRRSIALYGLSLCVVGTDSSLLAPCTAEQKAGHDLFSSERPQDIVDQETKARREKLNIK